MIISSSEISLSSRHTRFEKEEVSERLHAWVGERPEGEEQGAAVLQVSKEAVERFLEKAKEDREKTQTKLKQSLAGTTGQEGDEWKLDSPESVKVYLLEKMLEALTGKKFKLRMPDEFLLSGSGGQGISTGSQAVLQRQGWGLEYEYHAMQYERESVSFSAAGVVKTQDGREINIHMTLNMSREFASRQDISLRAGDAIAKDPLVINFQAPAAALTQTKYSFDIDSDGRADQLSFVRPGSGFLALDKNGDGKVNDGSELFGPQSGDGYSELANYDTDQNGWIDENDSIFNQLRIWAKDADGNDRLLALGQAGVGAIYLGHSETQFSYKDDSNQQQGQLRDTGFFLREDGTAGTVQELDLMI